MRTKFESDNQHVSYQHLWGSWKWSLTHSFISNFVNPRLVLQDSKYTSTYISYIHMYSICFSFQTLLSLINCIQDQNIMHHRSSKHLNVPKSLEEFISSFVVSDRATIINWVITNCAISKYLPYIIFHKIPDRGCYSVNICTKIKLRFWTCYSVRQHVEKIIGRLSNMLMYQS